ncbi:MAG: aminodeoxychorismate/anthranilate synthase component II [Dehalococcoidales bacterium]|jgi:anthranilate synthase/aminodeoxychorismate synthase-like glutamine amidotransferase|nr:aminodeoxychorismate/anthranilate synthase component II [Dehalococcoidales bacterium]
MILIIDNYDSFVYNLAQYVGELGWQPVVFRNDRIAPAAVEKMNPSHIIISPGPCTPLEAGISNDIIRIFSGRIPILGVCLGHQCIGYVFGGKVVHAPVPVHGKSTVIYHDGRSIYRGLPNPFKGGRYHSLVVNLDSEQSDLEITARTADGVIMGIRHRKFVVEGVQFHPESIMTDVGHDLLRNFLNYSSPFWQEENRYGRDSLSER